MAANHMYDGPHTKNNTSSNKTLISIVVDRSGSMDTMQGEVAPSLTTFIKDQSNGNTFITALKFDNFCERFIKLERCTDVSISNSDLEPRGMTSLYQAIGESIEYTNTIASNYNNIIFVILTDGHENSSQDKYKGEEGRLLVNEMISSKEKTNNWSFFFLGANIDSQAVGGSLGMREGRCINYTPSSEGCSEAYRVCSQAVSRYRSGDVDAEFNDEERQTSLPQPRLPRRRNSGGYNLRENKE